MSSVWYLYLKGPRHDTTLDFPPGRANVSEMGPFWQTLAVGSLWEAFEDKWPEWRAIALLLPGPHFWPNPNPNHGDCGPDRPLERDQTSAGKEIFPFWSPDMPCLRPGSGRWLPPRQGLERGIVKNKSLARPAVFDRIHRVS